VAPTAKKRGKIKFEKKRGRETLANDGAFSDSIVCKKEEKEEPGGPRMLRASAIR